MIRRLVAALVLSLFAASSAATYASLVGKACGRCGHGGCCAAGARAGCAVKSSCCDPAPDERAALDHGGKPAIVPAGGPLPCPASTPEEAAPGAGSTRDVPRDPLVPPPRPSAPLV